MSTTTIEAEPTAGEPEPTPPPRVPQRAPRRPADLAALGALAGVLTLLPLPAVVRGVALAAFVVLGPGAAVLTWVEIPVRARLSTVPVLGMAITTLVTIAAMWSYRWSPTGILVWGVIAVAGSSAWWYRRHGWPKLSVPAAPNLRLTRPGPSLLVSALALLLWLVALPGLPGVDASYYGLLFSGTGPLLAVAIVLCAIAFLLAVRAHQFGAAVTALGAAIVVSRVTTWVGTEVPLYDWTYKHIAVVDYILAHGVIQPNGTDIYAQWPAFFVVATWFCDVTGMNPMTVAHVFAPFVHVLIALTVFAGARVLGHGKRVAITAAFVVEMVNWVGQDYFSPQAWTLILAFGLMVLLLASPTCRAAGVLAIVPFAAMVPSHQLTPFWVLGAAFLLMVARRAEPWWALAAMIGIAGCYLLLNFDAVAPYGLLSGGSPVSNATSNFTSVGVPAKEFTSVVCRALSGAVLATAAACAIWQWRRREPVLASAVLAFASFGLLLGQSYGGEAIFRVYLYALLGCGLLIAPALVAAVDAFRTGVRGTLATIVAWLWLGAASLAGLQAYVALWPIVVETRAQVQAMDAVTATAAPGTRILMMHPSGMPSRTNQNYAALTLDNPYFDYPISFDLWDAKATFPTAAHLGQLEWAADVHPQDTYVVFSEQSRKAIRYYGEYRPEAIGEFQAVLRNSSKWEIVYEDGETVIFHHAPLVQ